jgi:hypothetical protein
MGGRGQTNGWRRPKVNLEFEFGLMPELDLELKFVGVGVGWGGSLERGKKYIGGAEWQRLGK